MPRNKRITRSFAGVPEFTSLVIEERVEKKVNNVIKHETRLTPIDYEDVSLKPSSKFKSDFSLNVPFFSGPLHGYLQRNCNGYHLLTHTGEIIAGLKIHFRL